MSKDSGNSTVLRKHVTIMFTDIVGYTALMGSDEDKAFEVLRKNRAIHQDLSEKNGGKLIKEMGDGMLLSFNLPSDAVKCAIEIQMACKEEQIPLKVGIHDGEVTFEGNDVFGDGVNISSRLQADARKGNIYVSDSVYRNVRNKKDIRSRFIDEKSYKNVDEVIKVYQIITSDDELLEKPVRAKKSWKKNLIFSLIGILGLSIAAILIWKFYPLSTIDKERSIAVMPFDNVTGDSANIYLANGVMDAIRSNLAKIGDLQVRSKRSTDIFRDTALSHTQIADLLNVKYIIEGSIQRQGDLINIHSQLFDIEKDDHIWADSFTEDIGKLFSVQIEIAELIAGHLKAVISPEEKEIIDKVPTYSSEAYDLYLRGKEYFYRGGVSNINRAIFFYNRAIDLDPDFALSYVWKGLAFFILTESENYFKENYADTMLYFANKALSIDPDLSDGYWLRAEYYWQKTENDSSINEARKAIQLDPNNGQAYKVLGLNLYYQKNYTEALQNLHIARKILILDPGQYREILDKIAVVYMAVGDYDKSVEYMYKALNYDPSYGYFGLWVLHLFKGDFNTSKNYLDSVAITSDFPPYNMMAMQYAISGQINELNPETDSLNLVENYLEYHWKAYVYGELGMKNESVKYFDLAIQLLDKKIEMQRISAEGGSDYYDKAGLYAYIGEKETAYEILHSMEENKKNECWMLWTIQVDPRFESIRSDKRYKEFIIRLEKHYSEIRDELNTMEKAGLL